MNHFAPSSIMIVGEDSHFCQLLRSYIRRSDYQTRFSHPNHQIVELVQQEQPALIILDVDVPGNGGWLILRELKKHPAVCHIPVMVCSWLDEKERGLQEGGNVYLRMPILFGDFVEALKEIGIKVNVDGE